MISLGYPSTPASLMASLLHFCRVIPFLHLRLRSTSSPALLFLPSLNRSSSCTATDPSHSHDNATATTAAAESSASDISKPPFHHSQGDHTDNRRWKDREAEIFKDIEPIILLTKDILHSSRYMDGERLTAEDEKAVIERLLKHHPHSNDKIGCGLDSIMVDRHPQFRHSRCLFVVRTDGVWIDFSYQKCLRAYVLEKYPSYAERFIRKHFKRG